MLGATGALAGLLILSFYSVAAGWAMAYVFGGFQETSAQAVNSEFDKFLANPAALLFWHSLFIIITVVIVARGILKGLGSMDKYFNANALFVIIILLCIYAMQTGAFIEGLTYLFKPDFSKINSDVLLAALGQAFFTLSLRYGSNNGLRSLHAC